MNSRLAPFGLKRMYRASTKKDAEDLLRAGIQAAEAEPPADPKLLFENAYVDPPGNMRNG